MNEPTFDGALDPQDMEYQYIRWARENKKRADRLLAAARAVTQRRNGPGLFTGPSTNDLYVELEMAALDYESTRG